MPLAIDMFCGLGGWTEGLLAEGYYVGRKIAGFRFDGSGKSFQSESVNRSLDDGLKLPGNNSDDRWSNRSVQRLKDAPRPPDSKRKAASALIAKIPLVLARHIAATWHPNTRTE